MNKIVWRIENAEGVGPYNGGSDALKGELLLFHCMLSHDVHPCAEYEFGPEWTESDHSRYGLDSAEKLGAWFEGYGHELRNEGFDIVAYKVQPGYWEQSRKSGQVAYDGRYAVKVEPDDFSMERSLAFKAMA